MRTFDADQILRDSTGGQNPEVGDMLVYTENGWRYQKSPFLGVLSSDPAESTSGQTWFNSVEGKQKINSNGTILASPAWT